MGFLRSVLGFGSTFLFLFQFFHLGFRGRLKMKLKITFEHNKGGANCVK